MVGSGWGPFLGLPLPCLIVTLAAADTDPQEHVDAVIDTVWCAAPLAIVFYSDAAAAAAAAAACSAWFQNIVCIFEHNLFYKTCFILFSFYICVLRSAETVAR